jgi:hypothetical protein
MDMKRHMLILFFISMWVVYREKEWGNYKMEVVIKKEMK